ncbi:MAG: SDR family oxidoreductase [Crinalium sp.]
MDLQLKDKVALITGASSGIGKATAQQFCREGARVAICARRGELLEKVAREIEAETGVEALAIRADITQAGDIERAIYQTVERFGGLDILVTNSGGPPSCTFDQIDFSVWESSVNLLLYSTVHLIRGTLPYLRQSTTPAILTVTSFITKQPVKTLLLSTSIRLAVLGLTKCLSQELGGDRIRVNSILPGWVATERAQQLLVALAAKNGTTPEAELAAVNTGIPLGRMGTLEEFANVAVFLCSPVAGYVNGATLLVDGGICEATL